MTFISFKEKVSYEYVISLRGFRPLICNQWLTCFSILTMQEMHNILRMFKAYTNIKTRLFQQIAGKHWVLTLSTASKVTRNSFKLRIIKHAQPPQVLGYLDGST
ncbi:hypothetical protein EUGRSUZ_D01796 [Eucalyptus grandis]|uniref:Uncharacterized protein n=2 Tax=Eucalyptus grandis TaxID=71139 RepID=A0ACC3L6N4_EUCGR|nr:hypothetical protein EUGRSUZ_D01796 [Eucalyptus grandis]